MLYNIQMNIQFFSSCCGQQRRESQFPFESPRSHQMTKTGSSNRRGIFSPRNDYGLSNRDPSKLTGKERELKELIQYENSLHHRIRELDRFYEKEVRPLEIECAEYREMNGEMSKQIMNVNARLRAVENGYIGR